MICWFESRSPFLMLEETEVGDICAGRRAEQVTGPGGCRVWAEDTGDSLATETQL